MSKLKGIHFYVSILNILKIIKEEVKKDDDLKRTIHRLHTFFYGFSKVIKLYNGKVEKYTGGRAHVLFEISGDKKDVKEEVLEVFKALVACFIYNNEIFNSIGKYSHYSPFSLHAGADYGEYIEYEIEDSINGTEFTTVGGVANNAAKVQNSAAKNEIYILDRLFHQMPSDLQEKLEKLSEEETEKLNGKIKNSTVYKVKFSELLDEEIIKEIREKLENIDEAVTQEANKLNLGDMEFLDAYAKIDFNKLSRQKNKKITAGTLCADIRGFTKLFNKSDNNLDELFYVMQEMYAMMGEAVNLQQGVKVQYQGDRIVAVFNDFKDAGPCALRMLKAGMCLNEEVQAFNHRQDISDKLKKHVISVGIGCSYGQVIATRLGMKSNKDNIILSDAARDADICEGEYADSNCIVINKELYDLIKNEAKDSENIEYQVLKDTFKAISTTGYYVTSCTLTEFTSEVDAKKAERLEKMAKKALLVPPVIKSDKGEKLPDISLRPWSNR